MDIYETYVELVYGHIPQDENINNKITKIIGYMKDNGFNDKAILTYLMYNGTEIEGLFDSLTENRLYYNNELVIEARPAIWHPEKGYKDSVYFREPKCKYDIKDLLDFYYKSLNVAIELRDIKRDSKALEYMINKYKFKQFASLDFIVTMIKIASDKSVSCSSPFDIEECGQEALDMLNKLVDQNMTRIIWRDK